VALQGVTQNQHRVNLQVNGKSLGEVSFNKQEEGVAKLTLAPGLLIEGQNRIRLSSLNGSSDISLVNYLRLTYQHTYRAEENALMFTAFGGQDITVSGFSSSRIRVFDVTDAGSVQELIGATNPAKADFSVSVKVKGTGLHRLLALGDSQIKKAVSVKANQPSRLRDSNNAADLLIVTSEAFKASLDKLKNLRQSQGYDTQVIDIEDIYDEFNAGQKSPRAVKDFLQLTTTEWQKKPRYVLFAGDASFDPKNYLGMGDHDLVPTRLIDTSDLEAASDDWFADFNDDGLAEMAIGRLPMRTLEDANTLVGKLLSYESSQPANQMLLFADKNDTYNFERASQNVREWLPGTLAVEQINRSQLDDATARQQLLAAINGGQKVVNYFGHGNVSQWRGNLLSSDDAYALTNSRLPLFMMMTCLNGYFQDASIDSLGEALMKSPKGGAIAVWASTGMTDPAGQSLMSQQAYQLLFDGNHQAQTLGEIFMNAKAVVSDPDVRRSWVFLGDPTMKLR
jgi:hypothetical protein